MKKKNLFKISGVFALSLLLVTGCGEKKQDNKTKNVDDSNVAETSNKVAEKKSLKESFDLLITTDSLKENENVFDTDALKTEKCTLAKNYSNSKYTVEYFEFEDEESATKEFKSQVDYQKGVASKTDVILDNENVYEAVNTIEPSEKAPAATETSYSYLLFIKEGNKYMSIYENSKDTTKEDMKKIGTDIKNQLGL